MELDNASQGTESSNTSRLKKAGSKAVTSLANIVSRRLSRSVSSERAGGSATPSMDGGTPEKPRRRFSLKPKRKFSKKDRTANGSLTDRPRRSMSVDDLSQIAGVGDDDADDYDGDILPAESFIQLATEKTMFTSGDVDESQEESQTPLEGLVPPDTPVPEQRHEQRRETHSTSNASLGMDDMEHEEFNESNEMTTEQAKETLEETIGNQEKFETPSPFELPTDAAATIDAGIADTVMRSFKTLPLENEEHQTNDNPIEFEKKEEDTEVHVVEPEIAQGVSNTVADAAEPEEMKEPPIESEVVHEDVKTMEEVPVVKTAPEPAEKEEPVATEPVRTVATREVDLEELMISREAATVAAESAIVKDEKIPVSKPKRRRRRRVIFLKSASLSVAALAVGLLIMVIKNRG